MASENPIEKQLLDFGFKPVHNAAYENHAAQALPAYEKHKFYIYAVGGGGYVHVALFDVHNRNSFSCCQGIAYTVARDDVLYSLVQPWRNIVSDGSYRWMFDKVKEIIERAEYGIGAPGRARLMTHAQYAPSVFNKSTRGAHAKGWWVWFIESLKSVFKPTN